MVWFCTCVLEVLATFLFAFVKSTLPLTFALLCFLVLYSKKVNGGEGNQEITVFVSDGYCYFEFIDAFSTIVLVILGVWFGFIIVIFVVLCVYLTIKKQNMSAENLLDAWQYHSYFAVIAQLIILLASLLNSIIIIIPASDIIALNIREKAVIMGVFSIFGLFFIGLRVKLDKQTLKKMSNINNINNSVSNHSNMIEMSVPVNVNVNPNQTRNMSVASNISNRSNMIQMMAANPNQTAANQTVARNMSAVSNVSYSDMKSVATVNVNFKKTQIYLSFMVSFIGEMFDLIIAFIFYNGTDIIGLSQYMLNNKEKLGDNEWKFGSPYMFANLLIVVIVASFSGYYCTHQTKKLHTHTHTKKKRLSESHII